MTRLPAPSLAAERAKTLRALAAVMPETGGKGSLQHALIKLLEGFPQLLAQHNSDSRRAHRGFPDWVIAGPGGMAAWELKRQREDATPEQRAWLDAFEAAGVEACVRRPMDLLDGTIARDLARLAGLHVAGGGR